MTNEKKHPELLVIGSIMGLLSLILPYFSYEQFSYHVLGHDTLTGVLGVFPTSIIGLLIFTSNPKKIKKDNILIIGGFIWGFITLSLIFVEEAGLGAQRSIGIILVFFAIALLEGGFLIILYQTERNTSSHRDKTRQKLHLKVQDHKIQNDTVIRLGSFLYFTSDDERSQTAGSFRYHSKKDDQTISIGSFSYFPRDQNE